MTNVFPHPPLNCDKFPSSTLIPHIHFPLTHASLTNNSTFPQFPVIFVIITFVDSPNLC